MKKIALFLILLISSITVIAQDRYAYISDIKNRGSYFEVTVSAKPNAFNTFPEGFDVVVSPHKNMYHYIIGALNGGSADMQVFLSPRKPSATIKYNCNENYNKEMTCRLEDFNVKTQTY